MSLKVQFLILSPPKYNIKNTIKKVNINKGIIIVLSNFLVTGGQ